MMGTELSEVSRESSDSSGDSSVDSSGGVSFEKSYTYPYKIDSSVVNWGYKKIGLLRGRGTELPNFLRCSLFLSPGPCRGGLST